MAPNSVDREIRIKKAIQSFKNQKETPIRELARIYGVPRTTLRRRMAGKPENAVVPHPALRLTPNDEEMLVKWIISMDERGTPPQPRLVRDMAGILLANRNNIESLSTETPNFTNKVDPQMVIQAGATRFREFVAQEELPAVLSAYANSIDRVFYLVAAVAVACFAFIWGMGWIDLRKKDEGNSATAMKRKSNC